MVEATKKYGIPCLFFDKTPKEPLFIESIRELKPDLAVVCSFNNRLPKDLIDIPEFGFINCHPSLLPEYRGGNPYFHMLINNEKTTGITIHYMDENFDTGDIIIQQAFDIKPDDTIGTLFHRLNFHTAEMLLNTIDELEKGKTLPRMPQVKSGNFKTSPNVYPEKGHTIIDWSKDAEYIERFTRACNPFYGAMTFFRGYMVKIWSGVYSKESLFGEHSPGTIANVSKDMIAVATGKGMFFPTSLQLGSFLITNIQDFIRRTAPKIGESFKSNPYL